MTSKIIRSKQFEARRAWDAQHIATMDGISVRLHWTDQPYHWHRNDGDEVFVVLDGRVDMHCRVDGVESVAELAAGDIFFASAGCEHLARPHGTARILVVEREGSD
jgi:mannose-6-phosphate isomerase-like protein (cupin superfamily)